MRLKRFDKRRELKKLTYKKNLSNHVKKRTTILSVAILILGVLFFSFARYESNKVYTLVNGKVGEYYNSSHIYYDNSISKIDCSGDNANVKCALNKILENVGN